MGAAPLVFSGIIEVGLHEDFKAGEVCYQRVVDREAGGVGQPPLYLLPLPNLIRGGEPESAFPV